MRRLAFGFIGSSPPGWGTPNRSPPLWINSERTVHVWKQLSNKPPHFAKANFDRRKRTQPRALGSRLADVDGGSSCADRRGAHDSLHGIRRSVIGDWPRRAP